MVIQSDALDRTATVTPNGQTLKEKTYSSDDGDSEVEDSEDGGEDPGGGRIHKHYYTSS